MEQGDGESPAEDRIGDRHEIPVPGNWLRIASGGRVIVADSMTSSPSRSSERGSSQAQAHRASMFFLAASRC
ncbi:MAG TPA: hypothetical protein VF951_08600 [Streptosporangiaceae bacterium]